MNDKMQLDISSSTPLSDALREYVARRLDFALDRFDHRLERVHVRLEDVNGPRGGIDKRCRLHLEGRAAWRIHVEGVGTTFYDAIDTAGARARRSVARVLERLAEQQQEAIA